MTKQKNNNRLIPGFVSEWEPKIYWFSYSNTPQTELVNHKAFSPTSLCADSLQ